MDIRLVDFDDVFLEVSYKWLTDKEIKELTMTPDINKEGQKKWFDELKNRKDYLVKGVTADGYPVGAVGLKHIDLNSRTAEYFGYIGEKKYWGKGIGSIMMKDIEFIAKKLGIRVIYLKVLNINHRALRLYLKRGYKDVQNGNVIQMRKYI